MIAIETGAIGHNMCMVSACATGTHNVGEAAEAIRRGDCIAVISGSTEAPLSRSPTPASRTCAGWACRGRARRRRPCRARSTRRATGSSSARAPARCSSRTSRSPSARRAIYAEVVGYGSAADGWDMIQPIERRRRLGAGDADGARPPGRAGRRGRPHQPARHLDPARRQARGRGHLDDVRRRVVTRLEVDRHQRHQVDDRSHDGRRRRVRGLRHGDVGLRAVRPGTLNYRDYDPECDLWVPAETVPMEIRYALSEQHRARRPQRRGHLQAVYDGD